MSLSDLLPTLLNDPPPTHAFELSEDGIAFAPVSQPALARFQPFEPGVLLVSPVHDNIQQPQVLLDHIHSIAPGNGRKRRAAVILPDYCARVAVLDFDTFPTNPDEQQALVRFRLKKSVPFEVETAVVSYAPQPRPSVSGEAGAAINVLAAVISFDVVQQYEAPFRAAGFHPGLVTTSSLAALNLLAPTGITLLVQLSGRVLSVLVLQGDAVHLARCVELEGVELEDIESVLHPTIAYIEDELKGRPGQIWLAGFGPNVNDVAARWQKEWGVSVQPLRSRFGNPGNGTAGLLGYLESVA